ncbi:MAG TPA: serine/threonine-protein kinase [Candidatus Dormibacteraeota bacterium]|nr:serine/threonine-protein kinase [Candidatus Dormibacteraeota bacterium]
MSDEAAENFLGRQLGPCELLDVVGTGTYGTVFRARDTTRADAWRAVKVMTGPVAELTAFKFRLPHEIHTAIALSHPHIVPVYRFGSEEGLQYLVMELVDSVTLGDQLRQMPVEGRHADPTIHRWLRQVASALDYAHTNRVVHAGLSPANILLRTPDRQAILTDFCLARAVPLERLAELGVAIDCAYRSPEQCGDSPGELTPASDVYALAAMLWHVTAGAPPFGSGMEARARHVGEPVPQLAQGASRLPAGLQEVLAKGLAKAPGDRHKRASQLVSEFVAAAVGRSQAPVAVPTPAPPPPEPAPPPPPVSVPAAAVPVPAAAPPVPVPVAAAAATVAAPRPPLAFASVPAFDTSRELRESPLWRPFPSATPAPVRRSWRPPLWLLASIAAGLLVAVTVVTLVVQSAGSVPRSTARIASPAPPTSRPTAAPTPRRGTLPAPVTGSVGQPLVLSGVRLTLITTTPAVQTQPLLRTNERFVAVELLYENTGRPPAIVNPYDWVLTDDQGHTYGPLLPVQSNDLPQRQLPAGGEARGLVGFAVPTAATGLALHFAAEVGDDTAVFPLS